MRAHLDMLSVSSNLPMTIATESWPVAVIELAQLPTDTYGRCPSQHAITKPFDALVRQDFAAGPKSMSKDSSVLMVGDGDDVVADLMLHDADFPRHFHHMQHPQDYLAIAAPLTEYIDHESIRHSRLIVRISWKKSDHEFIPMSFVCDTGAPMGLYLSQKAIDLLESIHRICEDDASGQKYIQVSEIGKAAVELTPPGHSPANIMGLRVLLRVGLHLSSQAGQPAFSFLSAPRAW